MKKKRTSIHYRYQVLMIASIVVLGMSFFSDRGGGEGSKGKSIDVMLMIDVSESMNVEDMKIAGKSVSRLEYSKYKAKKILLDNPGYRYGLGVFAGTATGIIPLTLDHTLFDFMLEGIDNTYSMILEKGTSLESSLEYAQTRFTQPASGIIMIFTDGASDQEALLDSQEIELIVPVLVGVGTAQGGPIPVREGLDGSAVFKTYQGETVISTMNLDGLKSLATSLGGEAYAAEKDIDLQSLVTMFDIQYSELDGVDALGKEIDKTRYGFVFVSWLFFLSYLTVSLFLNPKDAS